MKRGDIISTLTPARCFYFVKLNLLSGCFFSSEGEMIEGKARIFKAMINHAMSPILPCRGVGV